MNDEIAAEQVLERADGAAARLRRSIAHMGVVAGTFRSAAYMFANALSPDMGAVKYEEVMLLVRDDCQRMIERIDAAVETCEEVSSVMTELALVRGKK